MQSSDSLAPFGRRSGLPLLTAYLLGRMLVLYRLAHAPASAPNVGDGLPALRKTEFLPRRNEGLPGSWAVLFVRAVVEDPAGCRPPLALGGEVRYCLQVNQYPGHPGFNFFRGCMAHGPHVRAPTHRRVHYRAPSQGSLPTRAGSPLVGRVSHPLDDLRSFMKSSHTSILLDQPFLVALAPKSTGHVRPGFL